MDFENIAKQLEASPDFKVLRRLVPRTHFYDLPAAGLKRGVIVDTETTGVNAAHDEIIELGMVVFSYDANSGQVHRVLETISALEQPSKPIPPETTKVHGITDDMVRGKRIDDAKVAAMSR
jgi:DNA polymerase-3 subunit epsilon